MWRLFPNTTSLHGAFLFPFLNWIRDKSNVKHSEQSQPTPGLCFIHNPKEFSWGLVVKAKQIPAFNFPCHLFLSHFKWENSKSAISKSLHDAFFISFHKQDQRQTSPPQCKPPELQPGYISYTYRVFKKDFTAKQIAAFNLSVSCISAAL